VVVRAVDGRVDVGGRMEGFLASVDGRCEAIAARIMPAQLIRWLNNAMRRRHVSRAVSR